MKKFILAAAAAASVLTAVPAAAAPGNGHNNRGAVEQVQRGKQVANNDRGRAVTKPVAKASQVEARKWRKGERFESRYARNYRVIENPRAYRLSNAPNGYRWVQSGNDAILVAITSGIIGAVLGNAF